MKDAHREGVSTLQVVIHKVCGKSVG